MAEATVKTVQFLDTRIEPQPDPVYDYVIAPTQNQYYKIPQSGLSDSSVTFNNLTTLGTDRAYLDTFELEITADITFESSEDYNAATNATAYPLPSDWTFDSFPFAKCCDQVRVNINGGAFFSEPLSYLRAKERYMKQYELSKCYENVCPVHRPMCQTESGRVYNAAITADSSKSAFYPFQVVSHSTTVAGQGAAAGTYTTTTVNEVKTNMAIPTRYGYGVNGYNMSEIGYCGGYNNAILDGKSTGNNYAQDATFSSVVVKGKTGNGATGKKLTTYTVTWREPVCCSPFSSKYDATYGRPLYNITSMDIAFTLPTLSKMIRVANFNRRAAYGDEADARTVAMKEYVTNYNIHLQGVQLCYQVMTIPPSMTKPLTTLVPYRRFVPYISNYPGNSGGYGAGTQPISVDGMKQGTMRSGVYTLNEVPTAIWLFMGPTKAMLQQNHEDSFFTGTDTEAAQANNVNYHGNWDTNHLFGYIKKVNLSLANTTQILNTASTYDLYRIAKANGCQDSYLSWAGSDVLAPKSSSTINTALDAAKHLGTMYYGAGSVLRLKPGVDLVVPDQPLIPGANAKNMVFQAEVDFSIPPHSAGNSEYALWIIFEYVGVAAISPGQCEITMNPLGNGDIMEQSPVLSGTTEAAEGTVDNIDSQAERAAAVGMGGEALNKRISNWIKKMMAIVEKAAPHLKNIGNETTAMLDGEGMPAMKRGRAALGAGKIGYKDWM